MAVIQQRAVASTTGSALTLTIPAPGAGGGFGPSKVVLYWYEVAYSNGTGTPLSLAVDVTDDAAVIHNRGFKINQAGVLATAAGPDSYYRAFPEGQIFSSPGATEIRITGTVTGGTVHPITITAGYDLI